MIINRRLSAAAFLVSCLMAANALIGEIHLALTQEPSQVRVSFTTFSKDQSILRPAKVTFWQAGQNNQTVLTEPTTYTVDMMCGAPANDSKAWVDPGVMHTAVLSNLKNGSYYFVISSEDGEVSKIYANTFGLRDPTKVVFGAFGDMGVEHESVNCTKLLNSWLPAMSLVVHVGDISYARGRNAIWQQYMTQVESFASVVPYMVNCGNHDCLDPGQLFQPPWLGYMLAGGDGGECGKAYNARFYMPGAKGEKSNIYYSFNHGPVHFVMGSSEDDMRVGTPQYDFIASDLAVVDRRHTPFVFFGFHRPLYEVTVCGELLPETVEMRRILEPLLIKHKVDVVMHGHYHQYERTCALNNEKCADTSRGETGPVYVTIGTAGQTTQCAWGLIPSWSNFRSFDYGVMRFEVHNRTHLTGAYFESKHGRMLDSFAVVRVDEEK